MTRSASSVYVEYAYEDPADFGSGASGNYPINFGKEVKATGLEIKNNQQPLGQLYTPEIESYAYGKIEGKVSMEFVLSNPWFFQAILDTANSQTAGGALFSHTWDSDPTISGSTIKQLNPLALRIGYDVATDDFIRLPVGVVCPTLSFKMALNETIKVTEELIWGEETTTNTFAEPDATPLAGEAPYTFANAKITDPLTGTTLATIQLFDLNINSNAQLLYEFNDAKSVDSWRKILEMTGKVTITVKDSSFIDSVVNRGETSNDMIVTIDNKLSGDSERKIIMTFNGISFSSHNNTGIEPGELVLENMDFQARSVTVVATNEASVVPPSV